MRNKIKSVSGDDDDTIETTRPFGQPLCLVNDDHAKKVTDSPRKGVRKKK